MLVDFKSKADKQKKGAAIDAPTPVNADAPKPTPPADTLKTDAPANKDKEQPSFKKPAEIDKSKLVSWTDTLSPRYLSEYIGQPQAVRTVKELIDAAKIKKTALPHLMLYGSHGLGKTTFAKIVANEMGVNFNEVNVSNITSMELINILKQLQPRDILFIDEIHTLPTVVAEAVLYSAMTDCKVTYLEGKGKFAKTQTLKLPHFTLIGATTEIGKLAKPFTQRAIQIRLEEYSDEVLGTLVVRSFYKSGMRISNENGLYIARRCRNNPRIANSTVRRIADKALVRYDAQHHVGVVDSVEQVAKLNIEITPNIIDEFFKENGIDEYGLEPTDRYLLDLIINRYKGGPVGLDTLARALNESTNVITQKYEAYLIKKGMMKIEPSGRVAMPLAYKVLGLPVPDRFKKDEQNDADRNDEPAPKYEERKIIACKEPDAIKVGKIEKLIVYPENAGEVQQDLDELFTGAEKPLESMPQHRCMLTIDFDTFTRTLECDSFLESRFATCLAKTGYIKDIKAQCLEIPYISTALVNKRYFPDLFIKDFKNRVAIIEMKNYEMVSYHLNIDKYETLKQYCIERGYGYSMVAKPKYDEKYISVEDIINAPVDAQLEQYIINTINAVGASTGEGVFLQKDFEQYKAEHPEVTLDTLYTVLFNNRTLKNTDRSGGDIRIEFDN